MEYLQVFDENKNMLEESIERKNKLKLPDGKNFMIILFFLENNNKFLIQKCSKEKGSEYAITGGHVVYGDNGFTTCKKEVSEELGLLLDDDDIKYIDTIKYPNCFCEIYYSNKGIEINSLKLQDEEVESVSFMSIKEINELIDFNQFRKSNIEPLNKVLEYKNK